MAQTQGFMTALYERLSRDDELNGESQSEKASGAVCKGTWLYKSDSLRMMEFAAQDLTAPAFLP